MTAVGEIAAAAAGEERPAQRRLRILIKRVLLVVVLLATWQAATLTVPPYVFPHPLEVVGTLRSLATSGDLATSLGITLYRIIVGFALASLIGMPLGILLGSSRGFAEFFEPILPLTNSVSSAVWALFAVVWFGLSDATPIFVVLMTALPLIATNVWQGTRSVNAEWLELARSVRMSRAKVIRKIYVPTVLPFFLSGARLAFGFGARVSLVAEALGASTGVGYKIMQAADLVLPSHVFAWTISITLAIAGIEWLVIRPIEIWLFRWRKEAAA